MHTCTLTNFILKKACKSCNILKILKTAYFPYIAKYNKNKNEFS